MLPTWSEPVSGDMAFKAPVRERLLRALRDSAEARRFTLQILHYPMLPIALPQSPPIVGTAWVTIGCLGLFFPRFEPYPSLERRAEGSIDFAAFVIGGGSATLSIRVQDPDYGLSVPLGDFALSGSSETTWNDEAVEFVWPDTFRGGKRELAIQASATATVRARAGVLYRPWRHEW